MAPTSFLVRCHVTHVLTSVWAMRKLAHPKHSRAAELGLHRFSAMIVTLGGRVRKASRSKPLMEVTRQDICLQPQVHLDRATVSGVQWEGQVPGMTPPTWPAPPSSYHLS
jgi:hypothetical protein